jgi:hypothetical protein
MLSVCAVWLILVVVLSLEHFSDLELAESGGHGSLSAVGRRGLWPEMTRKRVAASTISHASLLNASIP